jgi:hypothetical protein
VIMVKNAEGAWVAAQLTSYSDEAALQRTLLDDPSLIPGCAGAACVKELSVPGVGSVDLVCVDSEGEITLVECKLQKNSQVKREIVGQIVSYASGLQGTAFESFAAAFAARAGTSLLASVVTAAAADVDELWFKSVVQDRLSTGAFRLVVAVDQINDELRRCIEYLNEHSSDHVRFMALELGYLARRGVEILVPQTFGAPVESVSAATKSPGKKRWTLEQVQEAIQEVPNAQVRAFVTELLVRSFQLGAVFNGGTGPAPSAGLYFTVAGKRRSVWSVWVTDSDVDISLNLGSIANVSEPLALSVLESLRSSPSLQARLTLAPDEMIKKYPTIHVGELVTDAQARKAIVTVFENVCESGPTATDPEESFSR